MNQLPELPPVNENNYKHTRRHFYGSVLIVFMIGAGIVFSVKAIGDRYAQYDEAYKTVNDSVQKNIDLKVKIIALDKDFEDNCKNEKDFDLDNPIREAKIRFCVGKLRDVYFALLNSTAKSDDVLLNVGYSMEDWLDYMALRNIARDETYNYLVSKAAIKNNKFDPTFYLRSNDHDTLKYKKYVLDQLNIAENQLKKVDPRDVNIPIILKPKP